MSEFKRITEQDSPYRHLEQQSVQELLLHINLEDQTVPKAVEKALPQIEKLVEAVVTKLTSGGRLFYIGAGTSGRLAVVDASECPPTFGVEPGLVIGIIAGGEKAFTQAVEFAEDKMEQGWNDLQQYKVNSKDIVVGLSASGSAPYVSGAMANCRQENILTGCVVCNPGSPIAEVADFPIEVITGPEFVTGSTRMKAGTAQKLVLNMISTAAMIKLGRVEDNKMVNMQLSNEKLIDRGVRILMEHLPHTDYEEAKKLLVMHGSVKKVLENI